MTTGAPVVAFPTPNPQRLDFLSPPLSQPQQRVGCRHNRKRECMIKNRRLCTSRRTEHERCLYNVGKGIYQKQKAVYCCFGPLFLPLLASSPHPPYHIDSVPRGWYLVAALGPVAVHVLLRTQRGGQW